MHVHTQIDMQILSIIWLDDGNLALILSILKHKQIYQQNKCKQSTY